MGRYPDYETYRQLYARYYDGDVGPLLALLEPLDGLQVMDICGGDGRLTLKMLESGAQMVNLVDSEPHMIPKSLWFNNTVLVIARDALGALLHAIDRGKYFDRIVCQQAVNYWLGKVSARAIARVTLSGGIFAFNTFNTKPSTQPRVKEYVYNGHKFVEVSWLVDDSVVHHVQIREGMAPHQTSFAWLSPERIRALLEPYFEVTEIKTGRTSLYRCERLDRPTV